MADETREVTRNPVREFIGDVVDTDNYALCGFLKLARLTYDGGLPVVQELDEATGRLITHSPAMKRKDLSLI